MASPFSKYTGEQIQPINYLPYTGEMARQRYEAISGLGKGIADAIKNYQQTKQERETMADIASGVIGDFVTQDLQNPEDKATYIPKPDAPQHHQDLIKEALKSGDGDIGAGLAAMPVSKLRAWNARHAQYQQDVKFNTEVELKRSGLDLEYKRFKLAEEQANAQREGQQIDRMNADARMVTDLYYRNEALKVERERLKIAQDEAAAKAKELEKTKAREEFLVNVGNETVPETSIITRPVTTLNEIGDIFDKNGQLIVQNVDLQDAVEKLGLREDDIITEATALEIKKKGADFAKNAVGRYFSGGNPQFDINDDVNAASQKGYAETFIKTTFTQADAISRQKYGKPLEGTGKFFPDGINGRIVNLKQAYEIAKNMVGMPDMISEAQRQGIQTISDNAVFDKTYIKTVSGTYNATNMESIEVRLTDEVKEKARYEAVAARLKMNKQPVPFSWEQYKSLFPNRFFPSTEIIVDGTPVKVYKAGEKWLPVSQLAGVGTEDSAKSLAEASVNTIDNWLKGYNKPVNYGSFMVQFAPPDTPLSSRGYYGLREYRGMPQQDYPLLREGFSEVQKIGVVADEMRKIIKEKGFVAKMIDPATKTKFENLALTAQTMRKYFIAAGQETDKDNDRLAAIVGNMDWYRAISPEDHLKVVDQMEKIVQQKVFSVARSAGFRIQVQRDAGKPDYAVIKKLISKYGTPEEPTK